MESMYMNEFITNNTNVNEWIGSKYHYTEEKELCDFYVQMQRDCENNHSRVIWEWLRNAPCFRIYSK